MTLKSVRGELRCGSAGPVQVNDVEHVWKAGDHRSLALDPIELTPEGLAVVVANERAPERAPPPAASAQPVSPAIDPAPPPAPFPTTLAIAALAGTLLLATAAAVMAPAAGRTRWRTR